MKEKKEKKFDQRKSQRFSLSFNFNLISLHILFYLPLQFILFEYSSFIHSFVLTEKLFLFLLTLLLLEFSRFLENFHSRFLLNSSNYIEFYSFFFQLFNFPSEMSTTAETSTYNFYCGMTCDGCKGAVSRILSKLPGVQSFDANVEEKLLTVTGTASSDEILEKLGKWATASGKELKLLQKAE